MYNLVKILTAFLIVLGIYSCKEVKENNFQHGIKWKEREVELKKFVDYVQGTTYLPVYSHIYNRFENQTFNLTITISIRNVSMSDSTFILRADYYNTEGNKIRQYLDHPVFIKPMETIEIVIEEEDVEGGSGANFIFDWAVIEDIKPPLFEAVMISTYGQKGFSFATRGIRIF